MKITTKGQVTIPSDIRAAFGLLPNTEVKFIVKNNVVTLQKQESSMSRGKKLIKQLSGKATSGMSTDEIMKLTRS